MVSLSQLLIRTNFHTCVGRKMIFFFACKNTQKQTSRVVPRKRCSGNMQQNDSRTPIPKCDFNKVAFQLYWSRTLAWVFACKFAVYFRTPFTKNNSGQLFLNIFSNGKNLTFLKGTNIFSNNLWQFTLKYLPVWRRIWMKRTELVFAR